VTVTEEAPSQVETKTLFHQFTLAQDLEMTRIPFLSQLSNQVTVSTLPQSLKFNQEDLEKTRALYHHSQLLQNNQLLRVEMKVP
jgi:hypothetical protein